MGVNLRLKLKKKTPRWPEKLELGGLSRPRSRRSFPLNELRRGPSYPSPVEKKILLVQDLIEIEINFTQMMPSHPV